VDGTSPIAPNLKPLNAPSTAQASSAPSGQASEDALKSTPVGRKLMKAAQEFEANLLSSWWEEAEKGIHDSMGGEQGLGSGFDGLKGLAMHNMAMSMVQSGGIGISRMIFHSLEPALRRKLQDQTAAASQPPNGQNPADAAEAGSKSS
jgi:hypothetical protein